MEDIYDALLAGGASEQVASHARESGISHISLELRIVRCLRFGGVD